MYILTVRSLWNQSGNNVSYVMMNLKEVIVWNFEKIQEALQLHSFLLDLFHNNYLRTGRNMLLNKHKAEHDASTGW